MSNLKLPSLSLKPLSSVLSIQIPSLASSCKYNAILTAARQGQCKNGLQGFIGKLVLFQSKTKLVQRQEYHVTLYRAWDRETGKPVIEF